MKHFGAVITLTLACGFTPSTYADPVPRMEAAMKQLHTQGEFNGVALVARGAEVLYSDAFGKADIENNTDNQADTPFRIASITKGLTATLVLQASERGEVDLEESVVDYLPGLTNKALSAVKLEHLLTHTSGIEDFAPEPHGSDQSVRDALVERLNQAELVSTPGQAHQYCNVGYTILGFVLEEALDSTYGELLQERLFGPAGMRASYLEVGAAAKNPVRAVGYTLKEGRLEADEVPDLSLFPAAGGVVSSATDLLRFSNALASDDLLGEDSRERMTSESSMRNEYGCTNRKIPTGDIVQIFQGGMTGSSGVLVRVNDGQYTIVLLSNQSSVNCQAIAQKLLMALLRG